MNNTHNNKSNNKKSSSRGGNKPVHVGPKGGKYVIARCDGKQVKRYLK